MSDNILIHPKFNRVFEVVPIKDIPSTLVNGGFKNGEICKASIAILRTTLNEKISEKMRQWRSDAGAMSVMCDDVQDNIVEGFEKEILSDDSNYTVFIYGGPWKDYQINLNDTSTLFKSTKVILKGMDPRIIVRSVMDTYHERLF